MHTHVKFRRNQQPLVIIGQGTSRRVILPEDVCPQPAPLNPADMPDRDDLAEARKEAFAIHWGAAALLAIFLGAATFMVCYFLTSL